MRTFLILACLLVLAAIPAYGNVSDCYYGITQDEEEDVEEDWGTACGGKDTEKCKGATCEGSDAACFKIKFHGEDEGQISYYGCLDSTTEPTLGNSWLPSITVGEQTYSWDLTELKMDYMPPADNCQRDQTVDDPPVLPDSLDKLEGLFIWGEWCACTDETSCNGVDGVRAAGFMLVVVTALVSVIF